MAAGVQRATFWSLPDGLMHAGLPIKQLVNTLFDLLHPGGSDLRGGRCESPTPSQAERCLMLRRIGSLQQPIKPQQEQQVYGCCVQLCERESWRCSQNSSAELISFSIAVKGRGCMLPKTSEELSSNNINSRLLQSHDIYHVNIIIDRLRPKEVIQSAIKTSITHRCC